MKNARSLPYDSPGTLRLRVGLCLVGCGCAALCLLLAAPLPAQSPQQKETSEDREVASHLARSAARPDDADALRFLVAAYVKRAEATGDPKDYDRAQEALDRADRLEPGDLRTLRARTSLLLSRHRFPQARALAKRGLELFSRDPELLSLAGDAALYMGDLEEAEAHYRVLHEQSQRVSDWTRLAQVAELRGNLDLAAELMNKAIEAGTIKPAPPETLAWCRAVLGEVELKRGKRDEARRQYSLGLELSPEHRLVLEHLAELEKAEGKPDAAEALYRQILKARWDANIALRVADLVDARGQREEAGRLREESRGFFERVVAEGNEGYLRPLVSLELAAGHFQRAATLAARDVALRPTAESRALLRKVLEAAAAAGKPVNDLWAPEKN